MYSRKEKWGKKNELKIEMKEICFCVITTRIHNELVLFHFKK